MLGFGRKEETVMDCPFCQKGKIKVFHKEGYFQARTSRISNKSSTKQYYVPDQYDILEGCPECGKTKKQIQDECNGKTVISHEERLERLRKRGLPLVLDNSAKS